MTIPSTPLSSPIHPTVTSSPSKGKESIENVSERVATAAYSTFPSEGNLSALIEADLPNRHVEQVNDSLEGIFDVVVNPALASTSSASSSTPSMSDLDLRIVPIENDYAVKNAKYGMAHGIEPGKARRIEIKQAEQQKKFDDAFSRLRSLLREKNTVDFFIDLDKEGNPIIHTVVVHEGDQLKYYDALNESHLKELLAKNGYTNLDSRFPHLSAEFQALGRELDKITDEISPRKGRSFRWEQGSIGNLNEELPFSSDATYANRVLLDQSFYNNSIAKVMSDPKRGLVDKDTGMLNSYGERAVKEMVAATRLIDRERMSLTSAYRLLTQIRKEYLNRPHDALTPRTELKEIEEKLASVQKHLEELEQTQKFSVAWMIMELNQPETYGTKTKTVREWLTYSKDSIPEFDRKSYREMKAQQTAISFNAHIRERNTGRKYFSLTPWKNIRPALTEDDKKVGFEQGSLFFYGDDHGTEDSFRIRNMLYHEQMKVRVSRDLPGVNTIVQTAHELVDSAEKDESKFIMTRFGLTLPKDVRKEITKTIPTMVLSDLSDLSKGDAKAFTEMTPQIAVDFLRDSGFVADSRWSLTKKFSRPQWKKEAAKSA